jgi:hypothetical protein
MKIGTKELPDICPNGCGILLKRPGMRLRREGSQYSFLTFSMWCPICKFESETVKIRDDYYLKNKKTEIEDVTPYKPNIFKRMLSKKGS